MRSKFVEELIKLAQVDKKIVFLTGDLGYKVLEPLQDLLKSRFINAGIAEQNMVTVAAGFAYAGYKPWIYSIAPFVTTKVLEQLKNDVCYQNLNIKIIGVGGGYDYEAAGHTHHSFDDIGILSTLPNINIYLPMVITDIKSIVAKMYRDKQSGYIRLPKARISALTVAKYENVRHICRGNKIVIVTVGTIIDQVSQAVVELNNKSTAVDLWSVGKLPLIIPDQLKQSISKINKLCVVEEHGEVGGLGSAISLQLMKNNIYIKKFIHFCVKNISIETVGSREYYLKQNGLDWKNIVKKIQNE